MDSGFGERLESWINYCCGNRILKIEGSIEARGRDKKIVGNFKIILKHFVVENHVTSELLGLLLLFINYYYLPCY